MKLVAIESPFAASDKEMVQQHWEYLKECLLDSINRGEAPFASHAIYPLVLNDGLPSQRSLGIAMGHQWLKKSDLVAVYCDLGISTGMNAALRVASACNIPVELRLIRQ